MPTDSIQWSRAAATQLTPDSALARDWDRLNDGRGALPFLCSAAVHAALREFGDKREVVWSARAGGSVVAMFVLVEEQALRWRTFQPSQLPLGAWVAAPEPSLAALCASLLRALPGVCLALSITQVDPLLAAPPAEDARLRVDPYIETAWIELQGEFAGYWAERGKNLRQNLRKQRNKLAAEAVAVSERLYEAPEEMAAALARYGALESAGWKAGRGTAIAPDNAQGRFYTELLTQAARRGEALVFECLFDARTVAMCLCLRRGGTLVMLKIAYDESLQGYSPAMLLNEALMQRLFAQATIRRLEYFGRVMEWHTRWTAERRELYHLTCYRWPLLKRLAQWRRQHAAQRQAEAAAPHEAAAPQPPAAA